MSKTIQLKIHSDGTTAGTYVCDAATGAIVKGVELLSWSASSDQSSTEATIHLWQVPCEIIAKPGIIISEDYVVEHESEIIQLNEQKE